MNRLPDELVLHIISYLTPTEVVTLQHISRHFLRLSRDNNVWKALCFAHSSAARRCRLPLSPTTDPRLVELVAAVDSIAGDFGIPVTESGSSSVDVSRQKKTKSKGYSPVANWDPSYPKEKVNWYQDFIQRHAEHKINWFQAVGHDELNDSDREREAVGAGILFDSHGLAEHLIAPMEDGSISIWDARTGSERAGRLVVQTDIGLLSDTSSDLDHDTRLNLSRSIMTETGAVECVSIDSKLSKGFFAVRNVLNEVDLHTLRVISRTPFPFPVTSLSEAHHRTPLTVGTNWTIHLHDTRKSSPAPSSMRCELIGGSTTTTTSFSRLATGDFGGHVSLSQPGALSILHLPTNRDWDGNGDIWIGGRFTSMLNFDRRFFPRLHGTVHSGARLSCMTAIAYPFISQDLRLGHSHSLSGRLREAKSLPGHTLITAGEYKGKGSLELYNLSSESTHCIKSSDSRTTRNTQAYYQNRQTASSSKLLSVAPHGTRLVFSDGGGNLKWVERDGSTPVRQFNINSRQSEIPIVTNLDASGRAPSADSNWDDMVQKILPTVNPSLLSPYSASTSPSLGEDNLILWTSGGKLALLGFGHEPPFDYDLFQDALENQDQKEKVRERQFSEEMRRALEVQARELRWLRGYGL